MANVDILEEVETGTRGNWSLCFQWCKYKYDDGNSEYGYRFIWRRPNGSLQVARGQARIPSFSDIIELIEKAAKDGWIMRVEKNIIYRI